MPQLTSSGTLWVDDKSAAGARPLVVVETSPDIFEFVAGYTADLEYADITGTGVFEPITPGSNADAPRTTNLRVGSSNALTY